MTRSEVASLRLAGHRLRHALEELEGLTDDASTELREEVGALIDIVTERINGVHCLDDGVVSARIEAVLANVLAAERPPYSPVEGSGVPPSVA